MANTDAVIPGALASGKKALWLHPEGTKKPYLHIIDGECACEYCKSNIRHIIYPVAA
jgi:hypothetical protein